MEWTDFEFVRDVVIILATQWWEKFAEEEESRAEGVVPGYVSAINRLDLKFKIPLEACGVVVTQILDEFHDILFYATQFISMSSTNYQTV